MAKTKIEYLDYTWNPTHGCSPVSEGCRSCWAAAMSKRLAAIGVKGYDVKEPFKPTCHPDRLDEPLKVKKPSVIGVSFMGDLFHKNVPIGFIDKVWDVMEKADQHIFIVLTKRPKRLWSAFRSIKKNIWPGVSVEDQPTADERIPILLQVPAAVRVVSVEPMLGAVELAFIGCPYCGQSKNSWFPNYTICRACGKEVKSPPNNRISWVICGPETGPKRRPCELQWIRDVKNQCVEAGVPFFLKALYENGKKVSMPVLDGRRWSETPEIPDVTR